MFFDKYYLSKQYFFAFYNNKAQNQTLKLKQKTFYRMKIKSI